VRGNKGRGPSERTDQGGDPGWEREGRGLAALRTTTCGQGRTDGNVVRWSGWDKQTSKGQKAIENLAKWGQSKGHGKGGQITIRITGTRGDAVQCGRRATSDKRRIPNGRQKKKEGGGARGEVAGCGKDRWGPRY